MSQINLYYAVKQGLKLGRWRFRRALSTLRWGVEKRNNAPVVFANAMPKSGSHLIIQILHGLTKLGPFVNPGFPPVNRSEDNRKLPPEAILANIQRLRPGDLGYGYIHAQEPFLSELIRPGVATLFVFRDPRDMIVSHVFYATEIHKGHGMHQYYTQVLNTTEERINAQILGVNDPGFELSPIRVKYEAYLGWLEQPEILCLRFEDLILDRDRSLSRLLDFLEEKGITTLVPRQKAIEELKRTIAPNRSGTFRKGKPGNWREHFTTDNIARFKETSGDLLLRMGFELDHDW